MPVVASSGSWTIDGVERAAAHDFLARFAPWRMLLSFASGPSSDQFAMYEPFNRFPLRKLAIILENVPALPPAPNVLDVGFNCGYNALTLAKELSARVTGIDVVPKHKDVAEALAAMVGVDAEFALADAQEFERPDHFDLVLHLGTLYHLPDPVRSIRNCCRSLRPGGVISLETVCSLAADPSVCHWIYGFANDKTNFWSLGEQAIFDIFKICGLVGAKKVFEAFPAVYEGKMSRAIFVAHKPG